MEPKNGFSNVFWHRPQSYYVLMNGENNKLDGGAIMNQASHYVGALQLVGPMLISHSYFRKNIEAEDTATINFKWRMVTWFTGSNNAYLSF